MSRRCSMHVTTPRPLHPTIPTTHDILHNGFRLSGRERGVAGAHVALRWYDGTHQAVLCHLEAALIIGEALHASCSTGAAAKALPPYRRSEHFCETVILTAGRQTRDCNCKIAMPLPMMGHPVVATLGRGITWWPMHLTATWAGVLTICQNFRSTRR